MKYVSTRAQSPPVSFSDALLTGLAPDGGLYMPEKFPEIFSRTSTTDFHEIAGLIFAAFAGDDPIFGNASRIMPRIIEDALNFPIPLVPLKNRTSVLELFHGPTAAFKDVGARFLGAALGSLFGSGDPTRLVLVATSGDTGGAVAAAFHGRPGIRVAILFPEAGVSPRQRAQLCCWGGNVHAFSVNGSFDDCQAIVKESFRRSHSDPARFRFLSANSVNLGRLLPQSFYYAWASVRTFRETGEIPGFIVPTGNLGNAVAALWAKKMGFPIGQIALACNSNRALPDFLASGTWKPQVTLRTLANAMDVGNPSNVERLRALYGSHEELRRDVTAFSVSDEEIRGTIRRGEKDWGQVWCPHTACAAAVRDKLPDGRWILVATAHPAKFEEIVEPCVGHSVAVPESLAELLGRPLESQKLDVNCGDPLEKWAELLG